MNVQEKMTMLKCYAYQKRESQGMEGKEAGMLEDWIDEEALAGESYTGGNRPSLPPVRIRNHVL